MNIITLINLLPSPTYIYRPDEGGYTVTKMEKNKDTYKKTDYYITSGRCSCMSWMKVKKCKHLDWLANNYDRLGEGVSSEIGIDILESLQDNLKDIFPDSRKEWGVALDLVPATINAILLPFTEPQEFTKLICIAKKNLAITFFKIERK